VFITRPPKPVSEMTDEERAEWARRVWEAFVRKNYQRSKWGRRLRSCEPHYRLPRAVRLLVAPGSGPCASRLGPLRPVAPRSNSGIDVVTGEIIGPYQQSRESTERVGMASHELVDIGLVRDHFDNLISPS
jgi:hypothetical protein